ncbi:MAG: hypothetical protein JSR91_04900 [Proteobacteria bacterium]|nr:hypothetical protein [Pseudomonadota bacterium]
MTTIENILASPITPNVIALILGAAALSGKIDVTSGQICLASAFVFCVLGFRNEPWQIQVGASMTIGGVLLLLAYWIRPEVVAVDLRDNEGTLIPADVVTPALPQGCSPPADSLIILFGNNVSWVTKFPHTALTMGGLPLFELQKGERGTLVVGLLRIFDDQDEIIARIDRNGFWVKNTSRKKRPDTHTLVVFDRRDEEVLRIRFLNPNVVSVQGIFRKGKLRPLRITENAMFLGGIQITNSCMGNARYGIVIG